MIQTLSDRIRRDSDVSERQCSDMKNRLSDIFENHTYCEATSTKPPQTSRTHSAMPRQYPPGPKSGTQPLALLAMAPPTVSSHASRVQPLNDCASHAWLSRALRSSGGSKAAHHTMNFAVTKGVLPKVS